MMIEPLRGDTTSIEWVLAVARVQGKRAAVWNMIEGCSRAGAGCDNCWAAKEVDIRGRQAGTGKTGERFGGLTVRTTDGQVSFNGAVRPTGDMRKPLLTRHPTVFFGPSRSDLFHPKVLRDLQVSAFATMAVCSQHQFLVLTKRPEMARARLSDAAFVEEVEGQAHMIAEAHGLDEAPLPVTWPLPNVWIGTSIWDQDSAEGFIPELLNTPAAVRFISAEPLLGPVDLTSYLTPRWWGSCPCVVGPSEETVVTDRNGVERCPACNYALGGSPETLLHWVIAGDESGASIRRRGVPEDWVRALARQCAAARTPFFLKQLHRDGRKVSMPVLEGRTWAEVPEVES